MWWGKGLVDYYAMETLAQQRVGFYYKDAVLQDTKARNTVRLYEVLETRIEKPSENYSFCLHFSFLMALWSFIIASI